MSRTILVGDSGSGKTTLVERLETDTFNASALATIGVDYRVFQDLSGKPVKCWDTAGAERFRAVMSLYYRNADFCILVFDASRKLGMKSVATWAREVRAHAPTARIFLVGNKIDWGQSACDTEEAIALAQELGFVGVAFLSAKHMKRAEILPLIQPLFNVPKDDDDWQQDDLDRPLLGGIELSSPEPFQPSRCCFF